MSNAKIFDADIFDEKFDVKNPVTVTPLCMMSRSYSNFGRSTLVVHKSIYVGIPGSKNGLGARIFYWLHHRKVDSRATHPATV